MVPALARKFGLGRETVNRFPGRRAAANPGPNGSTSPEMLRHWVPAFARSGLDREATPERIKIRHPTGAQRSVGSREAALTEPWIPLTLRAAG